MAKQVDVVNVNGITLPVVSTSSKENKVWCVLKKQRMIALALFIFLLIVILITLAIYFYVAYWRKCRRSRRRNPDCGSTGATGTTGSMSEGSAGLISNSLIGQNIAEGATHSLILLNDTPILTSTTENIILLPTQSSIAIGATGRYMVSGSFKLENTQTVGPTAASVNIRLHTGSSYSDYPGYLTESVGVQTISFTDIVDLVHGDTVYAEVQSDGATISVLPGAKLLVSKTK